MNTDFVRYANRGFDARDVSGRGFDYFTDSV